MNKGQYELEKQRREDKYLNDKYNKHVGISGGRKLFAICTADKKAFKTFSQVTAWQKHVERKIDSANVDFSKSHLNRVLIAPEEGFTLGQQLKEHLSCVKLRSNAALARSVVLTSSHKFQNDMSKEEMEIWIEQNMKFIKEYFGDSCLYAILHADDETTTHIHILVSNVEYEESKRKFFLRNNTFFGGREKLEKLQDVYTDYMQERFNNFIRGKKGSKAKNIDLKTFYGIMNRKIETNDLTKKEIETVIKDNYLLNKKYTEMRATYEKMEYSTDVKELLEEVGTLNKNNTVYKKVIKELSDIYGIDKKIVIELADKFSKEKENKNDKEIG